MAESNRSAGWGGGQRARPGHPPRDSSSPLHGSESGDSGHVTGQKSQTHFGIELTAKPNPYHDLLAEIFLGEVGAQLL